MLWTLLLGLPWLEAKTLSSREECKATQHSRYLGTNHLPDCVAVITIAVAILIASLT